MRSIVRVGVGGYVRTRLDALEGFRGDVLGALEAEALTAGRTGTTRHAADYLAS